jgi:hypothetical protein
MTGDTPYLENAASWRFVLRDRHVVETLVEDWFVVVDVVNGDAYSGGRRERRGAIITSHHCQLGCGVRLAIDV